MAARIQQKVNLYIDINPLDKKVFYVGIGSNDRVQNKKRNKKHTAIVNSIPNKNFIRKVVYRDIHIEKAWKIEKQIINKCKRLFEGGTLANIHSGGPLPIEDVNAENWKKGKKMKDIDPDFISYNKGKSFVDMFGEERAKEIISKFSKKLSENLKERNRKYGLPPKSKETMQKERERKLRREFTEKELEGFKKSAEKRKGKSFKERTNNPNWVSPRLGTHRPKGWVNPCKGRSFKHYKGDDYVSPNKGKKRNLNFPEDHIYPKSKPFYIYKDNNSPVFCKSNTDFNKKFNISIGFLKKLKKRIVMYRDDQNGNKIKYRLEWVNN